MSEFATAAADYSIVEEEPPEISARNARTGAHLWASATAFFFIGFLFAYFYLRSLNNGGMWKPKHVTPSITLGTLYAACIVGCALVVRLGLKDQIAGRRAQWRQKGVLAVLLLVAAIALQIVAWATQGFGPADGGYASVYVGWTAMLWVFVIGLVYWLETVVATAIRYRNLAEGQPVPAGHGSGDPHRERHDIADPLAVIRPQLAAASFYSAFIALIAVLTWIILYLV